MHFFFFSFWTLELILVHFLIFPLCVWTNCRPEYLNLKFSNKRIMQIVSALNYFRFIPSYLLLFPFNLFGFILEFEPTIRTEVSITWYRDPGCKRSPCKQTIQTIFCEKRQLAVWLVQNLFKGSYKSRSKEFRLQNGKQILGKERENTKRT